MYQIFKSSINKIIKLHWKKVEHITNLFILHHILTVKKVRASKKMEMVFVIISIFI